MQLRTPSREILANWGGGTSLLPMNDRLIKKSWWHGINSYFQDQELDTNPTMDNIEVNANEEAVELNV